MIKKCTVLLASILIPVLIFFTSSMVSAYPAMVNEGNAANDSGPLPGGNAHSYGTDIIIMSHLIEIGPISNEGYVNVAETLVFWNMGTENYTGPVYSWIPDGAFNVAMAQLPMAMGAQGIPVSGYMMNENVLGWNGTVLAGPTMPPMYRIEYAVPAQSADTITFTKKLKYPTLINYDYVPSSGTPALIMKQQLSDTMETGFFAADGSKIEADSVEVGEGSITYNWVQPRFEELSVTLNRSKTGDPELIVLIMYVLLTVIVLSIIGYAIMRYTSSNKFREKPGHSASDQQDDEMYREMEYEADDYVDDYEDDEYVDEDEDAD